MINNTVIGKGSYWEVKPGVFQYRFSLGKDPETGKYRVSPKRTIHTKKKTELYAAMEEYKRELNTGVATAKSTTKTVGEYAEQFHELRRGTLRSELSWEREGYDIQHIKELFGTCKLKHFKPPVIKQAYAKAREERRFSENELNKIHTKLGQVMKEAVNDELIAKNPCERISVPRPIGKEREALSVEEVARLLHCLQESELDAHIVGTMLLLDTGMRRGEMLGLDWDHVNFDEGSIYIAQQFARDKVVREPKSKNSKRNLHLGEGMLQVLAAWKQRQDNYLHTIAAQQIGITPVVCNELGQNIDPNNFNRWFRTFCVDNGFGTFESFVTKRYVQMEIDGREVRKTLSEEEWGKLTPAMKRSNKMVVLNTTKTGKGYKGLTPHMLRHTQATLLIGASTDIKTVQSRLGHSSVNLTLNTYSHAIAANDKAAADTFSSLLGQK